MNVYESADAECGLRVWVGPEGTPMRVRLSSAAAEVSAVELVAQIMRLHTLAYLRRQQSTAEAFDGKCNSRFTQTFGKVEAYAQTIDF